MADKKKASVRDDIEDILAEYGPVASGIAIGATLGNRSGIRKAMRVYEKGGGGLRTSATFAGEVAKKTVIGGLAGEGAGQAAKSEYKRRRK